MRNEQKFVIKLRKKAFACCTDEFEGELLFKTYCASCHSPTDKVLVGPGLQGLTSKYSMEWLIQFTQNSPKMIKEGDSKAVKSYERYNKVIMPAQRLTEEEVEKIFKYVDSLEEDLL